MTTLWGFSYLIWLIVCLVIAILYFFVIPKSAVASSNNEWDKAVLKYGHALVWILLSLACLVAHFNLLLFAKIIALSGLLVYLVFIFTLGKIKKSQKKA